MSEAIVDLTEVLDRQKITGFNARLLLLTFLVTTTYGFEFGPDNLAGSDFRWGWDESGAGYSVKLVLSLAARLHRSTYPRRVSPTASGAGGSLLPPPSPSAC